jgi:hypothetical protein
MWVGFWQFLESDAIIKEPFTLGCYTLQFISEVCLHQWISLSFLGTCKTITGNPGLTGNLPSEIGSLAYWLTCKKSTVPSNPCTNYFQALDELMYRNMYFSFDRAIWVRFWDGIF